MPIDPRKIINSPFGLNLAFLLGRYTPYWLGYRIAMFVADRISARKNWRIVQIVRCNQWVTHGEPADPTALDGYVRQNFRNIARSIFEYYRAMDNPAISLRLIEPHPYAIQLVQRPEFTERGLVIVGLHMSNFDIAFETGGLAGIRGMSITVSKLNPAYKKQLDLRQKIGLKFVTASMGSVKRAVEYLKAGGLVITAADWPDSNLNYHPRFFGRFSNLPIHYAFMALKAQVPVVLAAILKKPDGKYHFLFSDPIEMQPHPDRHQELVINVDRILKVAEEYIRHDPTQWAMSFPVWPEALDQVPK